MGKNNNEEVKKETRKRRKGIFIGKGNWLILKRKITSSTYMHVSLNPSELNSNGHLLVANAIGRGSRTGAGVIGTDCK